MSEELLRLDDEKLCDVCNQWPAFCKCVPREQRLPRAELLAKEIKKWTDEASLQGGLKRKAEQAQFHALNRKYEAEQELLELLVQPEV
jgi:hypothetical protein